MAASAPEHLPVIPRINFSRIAFFSSHGGSGTRGVVEVCGKELRALPAVVFSNNPDSAIIQFALQRGLQHEVLNVKRCGSEEAVEARILEVLTEVGADLIVLSGYMRKLGARVIERYQGRIFNIHPALLPKYGGPGMYGLNVHAAVLAAGERETGITIHEVNQRYDEGAIVAQMRVPVLPGDTVETLAERVKSEEPAFLVRTLIAMQRAG
jgi:phosphoribosylglycinamide formyltransferase-1